MDDEADQGVRHTEVHVSLGEHGLRTGSWEGSLEAVIDGLAGGGRRRDVSWGIVVDLVRALPFEASSRAMDVAIRYADQGVIGVGLGGPEQVPGALYADLFTRARAAGLHACPTPARRRGRRASGRRSRCWVPNGWATGFACWRTRTWSWRSGSGASRSRPAPDISVDPGTRRPQDIGALRLTDLGGTMSGRPRLMIVDDDAATRAALFEALTMEGMDVVAECPDAEAALRVLDRASPEVVLMDWRLPGMDGIEATRLLKERVPWVQVLLLTAYDGPVPRMGAEDAGAFAYLVKDSSVGFSKEIIRSAWERALDERDDPSDSARPRREIGV